MFKILLGHFFRQAVSSLGLGKERRERSIDADREERLRDKKQRGTHRDTHKETDTEKHSRGSTQT